MNAEYVGQYGDNWQGAFGILRTTHLMPDMNSVHQLQHALRLAGVDKEINL